MSTASLAEHREARLPHKWYCRERGCVAMGRAESRDQAAKAFEKHYAAEHAGGGR